MKVLLTEIDRYQQVAFSPKEVNITVDELNNDTLRMILNVHVQDEEDKEAVDFLMSMRKSFGKNKDIVYLWGEESDYQIVLVK